MDLRTVVIPEAAYAPAQWSSFFSAEVSAAAALTGLLFVAVSINLSKIIAFSQLAPRAAKALVTLMGVLFAATLGLMPGQPTKCLGIELMMLGGGLWVSETLTQRAHTRGNPYITARQKVLHAALTQLSGIPVLLCGISLLLGKGGGLYWLVVAVLFSFASAVLDTWVLLVEIQR
jgi:modulator of FtsH protease